MSSLTAFSQALGPVDGPGALLLCGVDEAGRGPWAGPVVAAAVVFKGRAPEGVADSKKLSAKRREQLFEQLYQEGHHIGVGQASPEEIDCVNILQATYLAMQRAVSSLPSPPSQIWVDGNRKPTFEGVSSEQVFTLVKGDQLMAQISAASIVAKVTRDRLMQELELQYPGYGFAQHAGYGVPAHLAALKSLGPCPAHRKSFAPIKALLQA